MIGGVAPSSYLRKIQREAGITEEELDRLLTAHLIDPKYLRTDNFASFFSARREELCLLIESVLDKKVQRDISQGIAAEDSSHFEEEAFIEATPEEA